MHPHYHTRTMKTAEKIIENLTVNVLDTARLIQEATEELGERAKGLERDELIRLLRRVLRSGISALKQEEHTVSFAALIRQPGNPTPKRTLQRQLNLERVSARHVTKQTEKSW